MPELLLHLLQNGFFTLDMGFLVYGKYYGKAYEAALKPLLIIDDTERILVDTGIGELPKSYKRFYKTTQTQEHMLNAQLKKHGLDPGDITTVINTHLHFDHCGNNRFFKNAKFYVQADELQYAYSPDRFQKNAYIREYFEGLNFIEVRGDCRLTDSMTLISTPGHSPGHQSVMVKTEKKTYVYCGDAAPLKENLALSNIPGVLYRADDALRSIDRLKNLSDAVFVFSHDKEQLTL